MLRLLNAGLIGSNLVVLTKAQIQTYNQCLAEAGIEPTSLVLVQIDGLGWSPQIAEEKNDPFYLGHGKANPIGIIITPDQAGKPVYFGHHSYDRMVMDMVFTSLAASLQNVTLRDGVIVELDQEVSNYRSPLDLLMINDIDIKFTTPSGISDKAEAQSDLVHRFRQPGAWRDNDLRQKLITSGASVKDLRRIRLSLSDLKFTDVASFYTRAFGGVYVFRDLPQSDDDFLIAVDPDVALPTSRLGTRLYHMTNPNLIIDLFESGLFVNDHCWCTENRSVLEDVRQALIMMRIAQVYPEQSLIDLKSLKVTSLRNKVAGNDVVFEEMLRSFDQLLAGIQSDDTSIYNLLHPRVRLKALSPNPKMSKAAQQVAWHLLVRLRDADIVQTYTHNIDWFVTCYKQMSEPLRDWVAAFLLDRYQPYADREVEPQA